MLATGGLLALAVPLAAGAVVTPGPPTASADGAAARVISFRWEDPNQHLDRRQWSEQRLRGRTRYGIERIEGVACLRAEASASASALYHKIDPGPLHGLRLLWRWKPLVFPQGENLRTRGGDDRAASVVVVFEKSILPWKTKALFYVWSHRLEPGTVLKSPFADSVRILVLRSGVSEAWGKEDRDVVADYRRAFGEEPRGIEAVGVLTDADNTGSRAAALYGPLSLVRGKSAVPTDPR